MTTDKTPMVEEAPPTGEAPRARRWVLVAQVTVAVVAIGLAMLGAEYMVSSKPTAKRRSGGELARTATLVETLVAAERQERAQIEASGTVMPSREIALTPEVAGRVVSIHPKLVPGGVLREGEEVARLDDREYRLTVRQARSDLTRARADITLEKGSQSIAKREFELIGEELDDLGANLVLRKPQLAAVNATAQQAQAQLAMAQLNLERTAVTAPFDAVVRSRGANVGSRVTQQTTIATLVGVETWWIEASVPVDQLRWINVPEGPDAEGSRVQVTNPAAWTEAGAHREGRVVQLAVDLEDKGRMARLLIAVDDPLSLAPEGAARPKMLLGSWVQLAIEGRSLGSVVPVAREHVRDGDRVWVRGAGGLLEIREVTVAFRDREAVYVSAGLKAGEEIVTTDLPAPVAGMKLRTRDDAPAEDEAGEERSSEDREARR